MQAFQQILTGRYTNEQNTVHFEDSSKWNVLKLSKIWLVPLGASLVCRPVNPFNKGCEQKTISTKGE